MTVVVHGRKFSLVVEQCRTSNSSSARDWRNKCYYQTACLACLQWSMAEWLLLLLRERLHNDWHAHLSFDSLWREMEEELFRSFFFFFFFLWLLTRDTIICYRAVKRKLHVLLINSDRLRFCPDKSHLNRVTRISGVADDDDKKKKKPSEMSFRMP